MFSIPKRQLPGLTTAIVFAVLTGITFQSSWGADPCGEKITSTASNCCEEEPCLKFCPDDYLCKPFPCIKAVKSCLPDEYCRKPWLKFPCKTESCCPDNYCRKGLPRLCRPFGNSWYKCVPFLQPCYQQTESCTGCGE